MAHKKYLIDLFTVPTGLVSAINRLDNKFTINFRLQRVHSILWGFGFVADLNAPIRSCSVITSTRSGKYNLKPDGFRHPFEAICRQTQFGKGWLVVLQQYDRNLDYNRSWDEYKNGFGSLDREFWMGLEMLHQLTSSRPHELLVELETSNGSYLYARYHEFEIGDVTTDYRLNKIGFYNGTAGDPLSQHKNFLFKNNDRPDKPCYWWCTETLFPNFDEENGGIKHHNISNPIIDSVLVLSNSSNEIKSDLTYLRMMIREINQ